MDPSVMTLCSAYTGLGFLLVLGAFWLVYRQPGILAPGGATVGSADRTELKMGPVTLKTATSVLVLFGLGAAAPNLALRAALAYAGKQPVTVENDKVRSRVAISQPDLPVVMYAVRSEDLCSLTNGQCQVSVPFLKDGSPRGDEGYRILYVIGDRIVDDNNRIDQSDVKGGQVNLSPTTINVARTSYLPSKVIPVPSSFK